MLIYITLGCVLIAWAVAWMASRRHAVGSLVVGICAAFGTLVLQRDALAYFGYTTVPAWLFLFTLLVDTAVVGWCACYVWATCEVITVGGLIAAWQRMFADGRRRASIRADVRRVAKQYRVEVA